MKPEEILLKQARNARMGKELDKKPLTLDSSGIVVGYNADYHLNEVQLWDGSVRYAAALTNGVQELGREILFHDAGLIDSPNAIKRVKKAPLPKLPEGKFYSFWMLLDDYLLEITIARKNIALIKLLTSSSDYPEPYSQFHSSEPGLDRINDNEFYMPGFDSIDLYNIKERLASTILGIPDNPGSFLQYTYSTCSLSKNYYFAIQTDNGNSYEIAIYRIHSDGTTSNHPYRLTQFFNLDEPWSIAAAREDILYMATGYNYLVRFDLNDNSTEVILGLEGLEEFLLQPYQHGYHVGEHEIREITYIFSDPSTGDVYCVVSIFDPQIPGLQEDYTGINTQYLGPAGETTKDGQQLSIIKGNFPPNVVVPGDFLVYGGIVYRVIDDTTVYTNAAVSANDNILRTNNRGLRTAILKISIEGEIELYYKFPGVDNRASANGYRSFYGLPCRSAVIDPKTKDIYMQGLRVDVIENGLWIGNDENFDGGNLIKITGNSKQLVPLKLKFSNSVSGINKEIIRSEWQYFAQLEAIHK